jgi:hypothetical protein
MLSILLQLAAIGLAIFSPFWAFALLILRSLWLFYVFRSAKRIRLASIPQLSPRANEMLKKFSHYYYSPVTANQYSGGASGVMLSSVVVTIIGCFHRFWWGILIGAVIVGAMGHLQRAFSPRNFLADQQEKDAHEEIMTYLQADQREEQI